MPKKKLITEADILKTAFALTRKKGFHTITARSLATALGCSTQPIYHVFQDMKTLEKRVAECSAAFMMDTIEQYAQPNLPSDLSFVLGYIRFAMEEKQVFQLIAQNGFFQNSSPQNAENIPPIEPKLIIFANGMIFMLLFQTLLLPWEQIQKIVVEAYDDFKRS